MKHKDSGGNNFAAQLSKYAEHMAEREATLKPTTVWEPFKDLTREKAYSPIADEHQLNALQQQFNELHETILTLIDLMIKAGQRD